MLAESEQERHRWVGALNELHKLLRKNKLPNKSVSTQNKLPNTGVEINTSPLARGQLIFCWASRIFYALARLASKILKLYFWVYMV